MEVAEEVEVVERNSESSDTNNTAAEALRDVFENDETVAELDIVPSRGRTSDDTYTPATKRRRSNSNAVLDVLERSMAEGQKVLANVTR